MTQLFSNGGGVQSTALLALIVQGKLERPDYVVIADTGREKQATWDYLELVHRPALASIGLELVIISPSFISGIALESGTALIPAYTTLNGRTSKLPAYCSNEWKQRPVRRWLRAQGVTEAEQWLGISIDESDRAKDSDLKWLSNRYPLLELGMNRDECAALVGRMGWPTPPKSSCWMCPHMGDGQWRHQRKHAPLEFEAAVLLEVEMRQKDAHMFLHRSARPLSEIDWDAQKSLFDEDELTCSTAGGCWV